MLLKRTIVSDFVCFVWDEKISCPVDEFRYTSFLNLILLRMFILGKSAVLTKYSQLCLSEICMRQSPKLNVYSSPLFFIFYCFWPYISWIFCKSKLFLQSQRIRLRQSYLENLFLFLLKVKESPFILTHADTNTAHITEIPHTYSKGND